VAVVCLAAQPQPYRHEQPGRAQRSPGAQHPIRTATATARTASENMKQQLPRVVSMTHGNASGN
jgi:hypothetical protein